MLKMKTSATALCGPTGNSICQPNESKSSHSPFWNGDIEICPPFRKPRASNLGAWLLWSSGHPTMGKPWDAPARWNPSSLPPPGTFDQIIAGLEIKNETTNQRKWFWKAASSFVFLFPTNLPYLLMMPWVKIKHVGTMVHGREKILPSQKNHLINLTN